MKLCCSFLLAVMALCVFADDPATKSLKDYETELRREFPFVEHKKGDKVAFVIDNGETKVSGTVVRINAKGVMVEENGTGIFYSFQRLGVEGGRFFLPEKYNEWIGQLALVKKAEADKFRLLQIAERQKAEQKKREEEKSRLKWQLNLIKRQLGRAKITQILSKDNNLGGVVSIPDYIYMHENDHYSDSENESRASVFITGLDLSKCSDGQFLGSDYNDYTITCWEIGFQELEELNGTKRRLRKFTVDEKEAAKYCIDKNITMSDVL